MKMMCLRMVTMMVAMMMTVMGSARKQDVGGRVIDAQGEPLPFVNVVLLSLPDSSFVQGTVTDEQGMFTTVEGGFGVLDEVAVEVQGVVLVVICRGRKASLDALGEEQVKSLFEFTSYDI